jgi:MYXO-CTERM domain-containing protein
MRNCRVLCSLGAMLLAAPVSALEINGVVIGLEASNSATAIDGGENISNASQVFIEDAGGVVADTVGASVSAGTRYAANSWVDSGWSDTVFDGTYSYDMTLTVDAGPGVIYEIVIESIFSGLLTQIDDAPWGQGSVDVSQVAVTGAVNGVATDFSSLGTGATFNLPYDYYDNQLMISGSSSMILSGLSGTTNLSFNAQWTSSLRSNDDEVGLLLGLDEANGPVAGVTAGEYATYPGQIEGDDGHFLKVIATNQSVIPEPSTGLLAAFGLALFAAIRRPRAS